MSATINVLFSNGTGVLIATLRSNGKPDIHQSLSTSGSLLFPTAEIGDVFTVVLACNGTATVTITPATHPATPILYNAGRYNDIFLLSNI